MGIMVYSLLWVMQDFVHQPYHYSEPQKLETGLRPNSRIPYTLVLRIEAIGFPTLGLLLYGLRSPKP